MSLIPVILVTFFLVFCCAAGPIAPFASKRDLESLSPSPSLTTPYVHVASTSVDDDDDDEINALTVVPVTPSSLPQTASSSSTTVEPVPSSSAAYALFIYKCLVRQHRDYLVADFNDYNYNYYHNDTFIFSTLLASLECSFKLSYDKFFVAGGAYHNTI
ncbi:hypothetical protein ALUC_31039A [Aspergillus luchuensis]|nr:hypothetical protein ALUC_31039A [Aspergillus luchuensis]